MLTDVLLSATARVSLLLIVLLPSVAAAQAGVLEGLLKNVSDINVSVQLAGTKSKDLKPTKKNGAVGIGLELAFGAGSIPRHNRPSKPSYTSCKAKDDRGELPDSVPCADVGLDVKTAKVVKGDTTFSYEVSVKPYDQKDFATFEVAIGYQVLGGFESRTKDTDVLTSLQELPSVSFYATFLPDWPISPYAGVRSGVVNLQSGRGYTSSGVNTLTGQTFQLGGIGGLVTEIRGVNLFVEGTYTWRRFPSVEWTISSGALPDKYPKSLDLSGWGIAMGTQIEFAHHSGK